MTVSIKYMYLILLFRCPLVLRITIINKNRYLIDNITIILFAIIIIVNVYTRLAFISSDRKVYITLNQHNNICPALYYIYTIYLL